MNNRKLNSISRKKQKGSVAVEYAILVVFIGLVTAAGAASLGTRMSAEFASIGTALTIAPPTLPAPGSGF